MYSCHEGIGEVQLSFLGTDFAEKKTLHRPKARTMKFFL